MHLLRKSPVSPVTLPNLLTLLPGPDRKRSETIYRYRLTYRNPDAEAVGCVMIWEVQGGRLVYQIAVERQEEGQLQVHCTCADAIFRAETEGRFCKHVRGFLKFGQPLVPQDEPSRLGA
jgi:hypothetical protein